MYLIHAIVSAEGWLEFSHDWEGFYSMSNAEVPIS